MNKIGASLRLGLLAAAMGVALSGCNNATGGSADIAETIVGIASDGAVLANASISISDANKTIINVSADADGRYTFHPGTHSYPFMLSVAANGKVFYSLITSADRQANINAASTLITQIALNTSQLGTAFSDASFKKVTQEKIAQAEALYLEAMRADSPQAAQIFDVSPRIKNYAPTTLTQEGDAYAQYMGMVEPALSPLDAHILLLNRKPYRFSSYSTAEYRDSDDLLSAGLGDAGMLLGPPGYPPDYLGRVTPADLRKNAIYNAYHSLSDFAAGGGYGSLWERVVKIPGVEYLGYSDPGDGSRNVSTLVQIPAAFDVHKPCIVVVPAAGLRGVYSANPTAEWGLRHGCAIAATDKGAGIAAEYIDSADSYEINGLIGNGSGTTSSLQFKTGYTGSAALDFKSKYPYRFALKFSHSKLNPEKNWGANTLDAAKFAFYLLNEKFGTQADVGSRKLRTITPDNTTVILAGDGEGGSAALAALEQDVLSLVDGAVLLQPSAQTKTDGVSIQQGEATVAAAGKSLVDYISYANLFQPCAALVRPSSPDFGSIDSNAAANRCSSLKDKGLLAGSTLSAQASEALDKLQAYGWQPDAADLHAATYVRRTAGYAVAYVNSYARATALDRLCDLSYAVTNASGSPVASNDLLRATLFADGIGLFPYGGVSLVNNTAVGGALRWDKAISAATGRADYSFDSAYCLRALALGKDPVSGAAVVDKETRDAEGTVISKDLSGTWSANIAASSNEVKLTAALQGKPTIILHGRSDPLFPVNHSSRPFVAKSLATDGVRSKLRYYEVLNAQHWDAANGSAGFDTRYVPLRPYLQQSLDLMYAHLTLNQALPPSQVLRTVPRGGTAGSAPAITTSNVPPIALVPAAGDAIRFSGSTLSIPN